jgi:YD repeat-containing protein
MTNQQNNHRPDWLVEREITLGGQTVTLNYDREGDILEIFFQKGRGGVGVDLTENIVLRYNRDSQEPLSLILVGFSRLMQPTQFGPPSFQLTELANLPPEMQEVVLKMLHLPPVNHFLKVSGLLLAPGVQLQPITYLEQPTGLPLVKILA